MGSVVSNTANGVGTLLGNVFTAPFKYIFGPSCQRVCSGSWDIACFIDHLCVSNLLKLVIIFRLCYIILMFFCLLFKLGICQCIATSYCSVWCALFRTCWYVLQDMTCLLWYKLKNVKRVNHRRHHCQEIELGDVSSDENKFSHVDQSYIFRRKKKVYSKHRQVKLRRKEVAFHFKSRPPFKRLRDVQRRNEGHHRRHAALAKRRRII